MELIAQGRSCDVFALDGQRVLRRRRKGDVSTDEVADLHLRLRAIDAGDGLRPVFGGGTTLVHGDLHPGNILTGSAGPMVIDWANAGAGPGDADAATVWLLISIADPGPLPAAIRRVEGLIRRMFVRRFLELVGQPSVDTVRAVCAHRLADNNMTTAEHDAIRAFAARHGLG